MPSIIECCLVLLPVMLTGDTVDYVVTGAWSKKAFEEAQKFGLKVNSCVYQLLVPGTLQQPMLL